MPRQKGMVLTDRDRALLGYLGVARYVTGAQAHRLLAPGSDKAVTSRRLARLCEDGSGPDGEPYLIRHAYRRSNSLPFPVWTLTPHGRDAAGPHAPGPVVLVPTTAGIGFVRRTLAVNELLLALVLAGRRSPASPLVDLPFRWRALSDPLRFEVRDKFPYTQAALLRPAAIIDLPRERRRIFVEPELGIASLSPTDPRRKHVIRRLERYDRFFLGIPGRDENRTWYTTAFPDGFAPEVLLLSTSDARRAQVEEAVRAHFGREQPRFGARAFTMAGALAIFARLVSQAPQSPPPTPSPAPAPAAALGIARPPGRTIFLDDAVARRLRTGLDLFVETYRAMRKQVATHSETCPTRFALAATPTDELNAFYRLLNEVVLNPPPAAPGEQRP